MNTIVDKKRLIKLLEEGNEILKRLCQEKVNQELSPSFTEVSRVDGIVNMVKKKNNAPCLILFPNNTRQNNVKTRVDFE